MGQVIENIALWQKHVPAEFVPKRTLRVAHLLPNLAVGGRERMTNTLCVLGRSNGIDPIIVGYDPVTAGDAVLSPAAPYQQLDRRHSDFASRLRALLVDQRIDVTHAQGHIPAYYLNQALRGWKNAPARIATMHVGLQGTRHWYWQIRRSLRAMDRLTAVSTDLANTYARTAGRPVSVVFNGIDSEGLLLIKPVAPQPNLPFRFAMLSRLDPIKRHIEAVWAADRLIAAGYPVELHIGGDGACRDDLARLASTRPWLYLAGPISDIPQFFSDKNAFLLPSQREGMPLALAEAMTAGLPAIVSDLPSLREMADDSALFVPAGVKNKLAGAMLRILREDGLWTLLSQRAQNRALTFDGREMARQYAQMYHDLAPQP